MTQGLGGAWLLGALLPGALLPGALPLALLIRPVGAWWELTRVAS
jgi:hypothetical protein